MSLEEMDCKDQLAWCCTVTGCLQEHLFLVCELLRANLYEFQKYNREHGQEPYFTLPRVQSIARQVGHCTPKWTRGKVRSLQAALLPIVSQT